MLMRFTLGAELAYQGRVHWASVVCQCYRPLPLQASTLTASGEPPDLLEQVHYWSFWTQRVETTRWLFTYLQFLTVVCFSPVHCWSFLTQRVETTRWLFTYIWFQTVVCFWLPCQHFICSLCFLSALLPSADIHCLLWLNDTSYSNSA